MLIITNAKIYTPQLSKFDTLVVKHGKVHNFLDSQQLTAEQKAQAIDLNGNLIMPGFIDLQVNGYAGYTFYREYSNVETLLNMDKSQRKSGVTSWLPTYITDDWQRIQYAIKVVRLAREESSSIAGIHIEGPFLSLQKSGTHPKEFIIKLDQTKTDFLIKNADVIKILTLAPEEQDLRFIKQLTDAGIIVSLGHSNATYDQVLRAIEAGASMATHAGNAMSMWQGRDLGLFGALLSTNKLKAGVIIDNFHLHPQTIRNLFKFNPDNFFMVTDAVAAADWNGKQFKFAGKSIYIKDDKVVDANGVLSGSNTTMIKSIKRAVEIGLFDGDLSKNCNLATFKPAQAMRWHDVGNLELGKKANFVVLNNKLDVISTYYEGYKNKS